MNGIELNKFIENQELLFDIIRLVDPDTKEIYSLDEHYDLIARGLKCYDLWGNGNVCYNCSSCTAVSLGKRDGKFEYENEKLHYVISIPVVIEEKEYALELISIISDKVFFEIYGREEIFDNLRKFNQKLYEDALTGALNRQYYEDNIRTINANSSYSIAMLDMDNFKDINDTFGHYAGDLVLKRVVAEIKDCVRASDMVIRYGGDEFVIFFHNIPKDVFARKLDTICETISECRFEDYPDMRISASIGGIHGEDAVVDAVREADKMMYAAKRMRNTALVR